MINTLFYLLAFFLSLGQLGRISLFDQQINIYLFEPVVLLLIWKLKNGWNAEHTKSLKRAFIVFFAVLGVSLLNGSWEYSLIENIVGFLYLFRFSIYIIFIILLLNAPENIKKSMYITIYIFAILTIIFSVIQYFLYPDLRNLYYLGWDPHLSRIFGLYFDSSMIGIILVLLFFWFVNLIFPKKNYHFVESPLNEKIQILQYAIVILLFILILLTYSRITYIGFMIGIFFLLYKKINVLGLICVTGLFIGSLFLLPRPFGESVKLERLFTIESRIQDYKKGFELFLEKPLLGYGYNRLKYVRDVEPESHAGSNFSSSFLTILVSSGIIGISTFLYFLYNLYGILSYRAKSLFLILLTVSFLDNLFLTNFLLVIFGLIAVSYHHKHDIK